MTTTNAIDFRIKMQAGKYDKIAEIFDRAQMPSDDVREKLAKEKNDLNALYDEKRKILADNDLEQREWAQGIIKEDPLVYEETKEYPYVRAISK